MPSFLRRLAGRRPPDPQARRSSGAFGRAGEDAAAGHLRRQGYEILERGFRFERGELDIVARDRRGILVFVEVKARRRPDFGLPEEFVTEAKRKLIRRTARGYVYTRRPEAARGFRFDVVSILPDPETGELRVKHYENAF